MNRIDMISEIYSAKKELNRYLHDTSFDSIKNMILWTEKDETYQCIKSYDDQLSRLEYIKKIWIKEKKDISKYGVTYDFLDNCNSLEQLDTKYMSVVMMLQRFENDMPEDFYSQALDNILSWKISGTALWIINFCEIHDIKSCTLHLVKRLLEIERVDIALPILEMAVEADEMNDQLFFYLADCWIILKQYEKGLECLEKIKEPDGQTVELINELRRTNNNE